MCIREEAKAILRYLKKGHLIKNNDFIDEVVSALLLADWKWKPEMAQKNTLRTVYIKNLIKNYFRPKKRSEQLYVKAKRFSKEHFEDIISKSASLPFDEEKILKLIDEARTSGKVETAERNKQIVYDVYMLGMTLRETAKKHKICLRNVQDRLKGIFESIRRMIKREDILVK